MKVNPLHYSGKFPVVFSLLIIFVNLSCSYDRGVIVKTDGTEQKGLIRFDECSDRNALNSRENYIEFKESILSGWEKIPSADAAEVRRDGESFVYIDSKNINGDYGPHSKIPAVKIAAGDISLYRYCSIKYMSNMFSSKRMDLSVYLLSKVGDNSFHIIPHDAERFRNFSAVHFSSCPEIVKEIENRVFIKKINNPVPGNISEHEFVDEKDFRDFVERYNRCHGTR